MPQRYTKGLALVIEDEADVRRFASLVLALEGLTVAEADTAERGLELACQKECVLVLLDLRLPGQDGWSVLEEMKGNTKLCNIPVIVFTASAGVDSRDKAMSMGAADYLVKPLSAASLRESIARVLEK